MNIFILGDSEIKLLIRVSRGALSFNHGCLANCKRASTVASTASKRVFFERPEYKTTSAPEASRSACPFDESLSLSRIPDSIGFGMSLVSITKISPLVLTAF